MCWVSEGALLYFLGKLLIGLFSNYALFHYSRELNQGVWFVHSLLLSVLCGCYAIVVAAPAGREAGNFGISGVNKLRWRNELRMHYGSFRAIVRQKP